MSAVAIIPAKRTSRRLPGKNRRLFHGKPIISYSIAAAKDSGLFDAIYVSTDCQETMKIAADYGCFIHLRSSPSLFEEAAGTHEVTQDCLLHSTSGQYENACCIYATAPMLTAEDLRYGLEMLQQSSWPYYIFAPGIFYWGRSESFMSGIPLEGNGLEIGVEPSARYIDINTEEDFQRAERMYAEWHA